MDWKKRMTGLLLAEILMVSMLPVSMAADAEPEMPDTEVNISDEIEAQEPVTAESEDMETAVTEAEDIEAVVIQEEDSGQEIALEPEETGAQAEEIEPVRLRTDHFAYLSGYGNGKFGPNDALTWAQASSILYNLLEDQSMGTYPYTYTDVKYGAWYYTAVSTLASRGILECNGGKLEPNKVITRGEFVSLVVRLVGVDETAECSFTDISKTNAYYPAIATAVQRGWISGNSDGTFRPDASLTRAQAASIFNKILGRQIDQNILLTATDLRSFTDVSSTAWYYAAIMEASINHDGVTNADGTETWNSYTHSYTITLRYSGKTTTQNIYEGGKPTVPEKDDSGKTITHWVAADGSVANPANKAVYESASYTAWYAPSLITAHKQYVSGYSNGKFGPNDALTRAQACSILYSLLADQKKGTAASSFTDVKSSAWYYNAVTVLASKGLITAGGAYRPNEAMTRAEFVEMVTRLTPYTSGSMNFSDVAADYVYYDAIVTAAAKGWVSGFGDGTFRPEGKLTRAEAVSIFNKILGRTGDKTTEQQMDSRYTFPDVAKSAWHYQTIMEASTTHSYKKTSSGAESWSQYYHNYSGTVSWESSSSVVAASKITNSITSTYGGDYTHNYNWDYSDGLKEWYVNSKGYSSSTNYLVWVSRQNQKVYIFTGSKGKWKISKTFICGTGKNSTPTPTGVTYITYREAGWNHATYSCKPVVRFYPNTGYAFHSRLYYPNYNGLKDKSIGWPVSAGCVRMLDTDITYIYKNIPNKSTVVIY